MEISTYSLTETSQWYAVALETDSYYEYLLKLWLSTGDVRYRKLYDDAASVRIAKAHCMCALDINIQLIVLLGLGY